MSDRGIVTAHPSMADVDPPAGCFCNCYLYVIGALVVVSGVEHLEATHVTNVAVEIGAVDSVAALSNSSIRTELLPQLFVIHCCVIVKLLDERDGALHLHWLSCNTRVYNVMLQILTDN